MPEAPESAKTIICPNCQGTEVRRSRREGVREALLHWLLFISPYRCQDCDHRFYRRRLVFHQKHRNGHAV